MTMIATIQGAVAQGWQALGDLIQTVSYDHIDRGEPQPDGTIPETVTTRPTELALFSNTVSLPGFLLSKAAGTDIQIGDMQAITLPDKVFAVPKMGDRLTDQSGDTYNVIRVDGDKRVYFHLYLRR